MNKKLIAFILVTGMSVFGLIGCSSTETQEEPPADEVSAATEATVQEGDIEVNKYIAEYASVDSISKASVKPFYEQSSLQGEELMTSIANREGAVAIATTNPDGSPNIATVIPGVADENHLSFGIMPNQTTNNLSGNKIATMSYYIYDAAAEDKFERNKGARLVLELVEDEAKIKELREKNPDTTSDTTIFTKIAKVLPLG